MPGRPKTSKSSVLHEVRNPLVFFALALLVIEGIMGAVISFAKLTPGLTFAAFCIMAFLFLVVVGVVAFITIYWPHHLYEQVRRDLRSARETNEFVKSPAFREIVQGMVEDKIKGNDGPVGGAIRPREDQTNG